MVLVLLRTGWKKEIIQTQVGLCFSGRSEIPWWEEGMWLVYKRKRHDVIVSNSEKKKCPWRNWRKSGGPLNADLKSLITNKKQWFSTRRDFVSSLPAWGHLTSFGDIFGYHTWREGNATGIQWGEGRDTAKHTTMYRQDNPHKKESASSECQQNRAWETLT